MSVESCTAFLRIAQEDPQVRQQLKAMTGIAELIRLGGAHGYRFDQRDLAAASATAAAGPAPAAHLSTGETTRFYHHEYALDDVPGFAAVVDELPRLKIKPSTVDLAGFDQRFRVDDLASTSMAPNGAEYQRWRSGVLADEGRNTRRDFHLINLDNHVAHPEYDDYLAAKTRVIAALENLFDSEVRFSGSMWYPPSSYRLWHTNEEQPGWRMYIIDTDADYDEDTSFFRYQHPDTGELVTLRERPRMARFFKVEQDPDRLFWHCIVNPTRRHRWSFGFTVPGTWIERLPARP